MTTSTVAVVFVFMLHVLSISNFRSLYLESISFCGDRDVDEQTGFLLLVFHYHIRCVRFDLFVSKDQHVPNNSSYFVFGDSRRPMLVTFVLHFNATVLADCPVKVCCCLVVALYILCFANFQTSCYKIVNSLLIGKFCKSG